MQIPIMIAVRDRYEPELFKHPRKACAQIPLCVNVDDIFLFYLKMYKH
jgi:hypothetical protein